MTHDDLENELRNLKLTHLAERELAGYCDQGLDRTGRARVEAHIKQCFICARQLELLREENAALNNRVIAVEEVAFVERLMEQTTLAQNPSNAEPAETSRDVPWQERLADYLRQIVASWQIEFTPVRRGDHGQELWRWQSEDGHLLARATMETNADMIVRFSSNEMAMDGARLHFHLDLLNEELTLRRTSESEVGAQVAIPWPYRQGNMADISIEII